MGDTLILTISWDEIARQLWLAAASPVQRNQIPEIVERMRRLSLSLTSAALLQEIIYAGIAISEEDFLGRAPPDAVRIC